MIGPKWPGGVNLQLFAGEEDSNGAKPVESLISKDKDVDVEQSPKEEFSKEEISYTDAQRADIDRKMQEGWKTREKNLRKQLEVEQQAKQKEAELKSQNKYQELYENTLKDLEAKKVELVNKEIDFETRKQLRSKGLSEDLVKFVKPSKLEEVEDAVDAFSLLVKGSTDKEKEEKKNIPGKNGVKGTEKETSDEKGEFDKIKDARKAEADRVKKSVEVVNNFFKK